MVDNSSLLIDLSSMPYGDDSDDEFAVMDLIDGAVVSYADAPGVASF